MESTLNNFAQLKSGGGDKESVKAGQDDRAEQPMEVPNGEMKQLASQVHLVVCGGRAGALGILPEELWLQFLEEYADSAEDIRNVLLAFPQLDKLFQKKKASWLFPLVLPHLVTKYLFAVVKNTGGWTSMRSQELLNLRLVSKRWKAAVEKSLENHNERRPLLPRESPEAGPNAVAIPDNHFNYYRIRNYPLGLSRFEDAESIDAFLEEMRDFQGNPFPGKSVILLMADDDTNFGQALARFVVILERFGQHVLDLTIDHWIDPEPNIGNLELYRNILKCLTLVPNLRSLTFTGFLFGAIDTERNHFFGEPENQNLFPVLRNLERFELNTRLEDESIWITLILETYGRNEGLRKLGMSQDLLSTVNLALYQSVHLTELQLFLDDDSDQDFDGICRLVKGLPNHQEIRKFWLRASVPLGRVRINQLIRMLAEFKFESVVLEDFELVEGPPTPTPEALLPAITVSSLDLEETGEQGWSYDFLRELPNLKFLSVRIESRRLRQILKEYRKMKRDGKVVDLEVGSLGKRLTRYVMKAYDPASKIPENAGIWEGIPSLEMLSLSMPLDSLDEDVKYLGVRFVRERGNKAFFGPSPKVVRWHQDEEEVEEVSEM